MYFKSECHMLRFQNKFHCNYFQMCILKKLRELRKKKKLSYQNQKTFGQEKVLALFQRMLRDMTDVYNKRQHYTVQIISSVIDMFYASAANKITINIQIFSHLS